MDTYLYGRDVLGDSLLALSGSRSPLITVRDGDARHISDRQSRSVGSGRKLKNQISVHLERGGP